MRCTPPPPPAAHRGTAVHYGTVSRQVALSEAVDMVYEMGGGKMTTVHF